MVTPGFFQARDASGEATVGVGAVAGVVDFVVGRSTEYPQGSTRFHKTGAK